jgi:DHA1 family multidrug resistance protein-like MFS transporter
VRRLGVEQWRRNNFAATLSVFLLTAGFGFTIPFLPVYLQEIDDLSPERAAFWAGIATALGGVGSMVSGPIWGILGDRVGRKPMLVRAAFGGSIGLFAFAFAATTWQVVAIRFFIGVMAGAPAAAMALIASSTPPEHLTSSLGRFQAATQAGLAVGPLVAAGLLSFLGFAWTFVLTSLVMLLGAVATIFMVVEERTTDATRAVRPKGALGEALRSPTVLAVLFVVLVLGAGRPMTQPILPGFVDEILGGKGSVNFTIGLLFFGMSALSAVAALYAGRLNERFGFNLVVLVTCLGSAVLIGLQGASANVIQLIALTWVVALLQGVLATGTVAILSSAVSAAVVSGVFGVYQSVQAASGQFGPAVGGSLAVGIGFRWVFPVAGALFFVAGAVAYIVLRRTSRDPAVAD